MKPLYLNRAYSEIFKKIMLVCAFGSFAATSNAQDTGTLVISKRAQSALSPGVDFNFTTDNLITGLFSLNDGPDFISIQDVGMSANNAIWAIEAPSLGGGNGNVYFRQAGSSSWIQTGRTGTRLDVNLSGGAALINEAGALYTTNASGAFATVSTTINAVDVGVSAGSVQNVFVLVKNSSGCHTLTRSRGFGFVNDYTNICGTHLDVAPDGSVYVLNELASAVYRVTFSPSDEVATIDATYESLGFRDITVAADGKVWAVNETKCYLLTDGVWVRDENSSGVGFGSNAAGLSAGKESETPIVTLNAKNDVANSARGRIIQRREDGTWLNDHTVRTSGPSNSIIFNVAPGTYMIEENQNQQSWKLIGINSSGGSAVNNMENRNVTVTVAANETVHLEFVNAAYDYGDAPDSYGTQTGSNGPFHEINQLLSLGGSIDGEQDGLPGTTATGDNNYIYSDEDGIASFPGISGGLNRTVSDYSLNVSAVNRTTSTANLCGWIDWNSNGTFEAGEGVCTTVAPAGTEATLTWPTVTLGGPDGLTGLYARFRLTTGPLTTASFNGAAIDGEVEDYFIPFENPLPVTLVRFEALAQENQVALTWATTEETNADRFEIEYSANGKIWKAIGTIAAKGESIVEQNYMFNHESPLKGQNLYRLKMIDQDNTYAISKIQSVIMDQNASLIAYPNPVTSKIKIRNYEQVSKVTLYNGLGIEISESTKLSSDGIDVSKLPQGIYTVTLLLSDGTVSTQKMLVTK